MVAGEPVDVRLLRRVEELYSRIARRVGENGNGAGECRRCGRCCDFEVFDHRLYVTPPEVAYFAANLSPERISGMANGRCPYNLDGRCTTYHYRFAGCRIFSCGGNVEFQGSVSEEVMEELKSICAEFGLSYSYEELGAALRRASGV